MNPKFLLVEAKKSPTPNHSLSGKVWTRLLDIAEQKNVPVVLTSLARIGANAVLLTYKDNQMILIEIDASKKKRNLYLAHELGHLQLHVGAPVFTCMANGTGGERDDEIERQAERFGRRLIRFIGRMK